MTHPARVRVERVREASTATTLELFFDLVFVFALTQVTALMADDVSGRGLLRGVLLIAVVWWCWVGYSWLSNVVKADEGWARVTLLVAMAAMFLLALAIPESFVDLPGGLTSASFDTFDRHHFETDYGVGLQYRYSRQFTLRLDYGHSNESNKVWLSFNRVF